MVRCFFVIVCSDWLCLFVLSVYGCLVVVLNVLNWWDVGYCLVLLGLFYLFNSVGNFY